MADEEELEEGETSEIMKAEEENRAEEKTDEDKNRIEEEKNRMSKRKMPEIGNERKRTKSK
jgi:hypothetical protein